MATTQNTFNGNGSNLGPFSFTFKWLESTDIKVSVGGVLKTAGTHYNLQNLNYNPLTGKTGGEVLFTAGNAPPVGTNNIRIYRDTDDEALSAVFSSGSAIRAKDLNDNFTQNLYVTQEVNNNAVSIDGSNPMVGNLNFNNFKVVNLGTPTVATDASTKGYVDSVVATGAANAAAAAASASAAAGSATAAANSFDAFDDRYLGVKASDPVVDNDGNALITGAMYFNSTTNRTKIYNGTIWIDAGVPGSLVRWTKTAAGGETSLSGNDNNSNALNYTPGSEQVFLNGALLTRGVDYTATTGTTITGLVALTAGDVVDVLSLNQYVVGTVPDQSVTNAKVANAAGIAASKLSFTQAGTGAVTRTVDSKLKDVVSVKDFGAVGDGVADDTAALAAMFTHCNAQGLPWYIPSGNYLIQQNSVLTVKTSGACDGRLLIPKANRTSRIEIKRDVDFLALNTSGWNSLTRGSLNINALNAVGMLVSIESTEILIPRNNPPSNTPYYKQEVVRCLDKDGFFSTPLVNTYNPAGNTITVRGAALSTPIKITGLNILITGSDSGSGSWREKVRVERDRVTLEDLTIINNNPAEPIENAVYVAYAADVTFSRPFIRGMVFAGSGYGIQFSNTIGCKVLNGDIQECRRAISGRHNCDLTIDGGNYSESIDDHWGDRMVISNLTVTSTSTGDSSITYAGNDIRVSNVTAYGGRNFFGIRTDTPSLGGNVVISKVNVYSQLPGDPYWLFGHTSFTFQGSPGTYPAGFTYKTPDLLSITDINLSVTAAYQCLFFAYAPSSGGNEPAGAWQAWKQIDLSGPFNFGTTATIAMLLVKDGSKTVGNPKINIDCHNTSLPSSSQLFYISSLDSSTSGRASVTLSNAKGPCNLRYSGYAVSKLLVDNCQIGNVAQDQFHPVSGCVSVFSNCEFSGATFEDAQTDCFFSGCLFNTEYSEFPATRCAWVGCVRTAAQGALPTDIRANVLSPFL